MHREENRERYVKAPEGRAKPHREPSPRGWRKGLQTEENCDGEQSDPKNSRESPAEYVECGNQSALVHLLIGERNIGEESP
jgi:hypothetical protein